MATFVLVHGTTGGGWVWKSIASTLRQAGHQVYTPTLTGLGERVHLLSRQVSLDTHIDDVANVLRFEELHDVLLVGHSYAGMVITGVADQVSDRIAHLLFFDAMVPENGESSLDLMAAESRRQMEERVRTEGHGWLIPVTRGPNDPPSRNTPHPWKTWADHLHLAHPARNGLPSAYLRFTADKQPKANMQLALEKSWQRAQGPQWRRYEVDTVHQIVPDPAPKGTLLLRLAQELT